MTDTDRQTAPQDHWTVVAAIKAARALIEAGNALSLAAQTTGGTAGRDAGLCAAIAHWVADREKWKQALRIIELEGDDPEIGAGILTASARITGDKDRETPGRAPPPDGWQPMETAPRDGTAFQAKIPGHGADNVIAWTDGAWAFTSEQEPPDCWTDGYCWDVNEDGAPSVQPTHWKPLPPDGPVTVTQGDREVAAMAVTEDHAGQAIIRGERGC